MRLHSHVATVSIDVGKKTGKLGTKAVFPVYFIANIISFFSFYVATFLRITGLLQVYKKNIFYVAHYAEPLVCHNIFLSKSLPNFAWTWTHLNPFWLQFLLDMVLPFSSYCDGFLIHVW